MLRDFLSFNSFLKKVSKELEEVGGSEIKDEREINKGPNPYRSYDIEFTEHGGRIGKGADGAAFICTNKFDLGTYVVKKIPFNRKSEGRVKRVGRFKLWQLYNTAMSSSTFREIFDRDFPV